MIAASAVGLLAGAVIGGALMVNARTWAPAFPLMVTGLVVTAAAFAFESGVSLWRRPVRGSHPVSTT